MLSRNGGKKVCFVNIVGQAEFICVIVTKCQDKVYVGTALDGRECHEKCPIYIERKCYQGLLLINNLIKLVNDIDLGVECTNRKLELLLFRPCFYEIKSRGCTCSESSSILSPRGENLEAKIYCLLPLPSNTRSARK